MIGVQETPCVEMNRLVICTCVEQQRGKDAAFLEDHYSVCAICCVCQRGPHKNCLLNNMFWITSVSITSCVISKNFNRNVSPLCPWVWSI